MVMVILRRGRSQFMSEAPTRTINGKEDPLWEDLERGTPRGAGATGRGDCSWDANWESWEKQVSF